MLQRGPGGPGLHLCAQLLLLEEGTCTWAWRCPHPVLPCSSLHGSPRAPVRRCWRRSHRADTRPTGGAHRHHGGSAPFHSAQQPVRAPGHGGDPWRLVGRLLGCALAPCACPMLLIACWCCCTRGPCQAALPAARCGRAAAVARSCASHGAACAACPAPAGKVASDTCQALGLEHPPATLGLPTLSQLVDDQYLRVNAPGSVPVAGEAAEGRCRRPSPPLCSPTRALCAGQPCCPPPGLRP